MATVKTAAPTLVRISGSTSLNQSVHVKRYRGLCRVDQPLEPCSHGRAHKLPYTLTHTEISSTNHLQLRTIYCADLHAKRKHVHMTKTHTPPEHTHEHTHTEHTHEHTHTHVTLIQGSAGRVLTRVLLSVTFTDASSGRKPLR